MKLLYCTKCHDLFNLALASKECACGATGGYYTDMFDAVYWGEEAVPIGIHNDKFKEARDNPPEPDADWGERFEAWVCPKNAPTFVEIPLDVPPTSECIKCGTDLPLSEMSYVPPSFIIPAGNYCQNCYAKKWDDA